MDYSGETVLVTGGDGFIGSHLVEALVRAGAQVTALAQYTSFGTAGWLDELPRATLERITVIRGDIRDSGFVRDIARDQGIILHLAALIAIPYSYTAPHSYVETNVNGTLNILEAARAHGTKRVVVTSTSEVYGSAQFTPMHEEHPLQGQSPYSASKIGADMMAQAFARSFGLPVVILRPFNTFGPRQSERAVIPTVIRQALDPNSSVIRVGSLEPRRDFTFVEDTAQAFLHAGKTECLEYGVPYNAGTGVAVSIGDIVNQVREITGSNKPVETESQRIRPEKSEVTELLADASRFKAASAWKPAFDLPKGLSATVDWWRHRIEAGKVRASDSYLV